MTTYIAIDPGNTSGWALFNEDGTLDHYGQTKGIDEFLDWIEGLVPFPTTAIIEDYVIRKTVSHAGSRAPTIQLIGALKRLFQKHGTRIIMQTPQVKKVGYVFANMKPPKSHASSHQYDAYAHGVYWLQRNQIRKPRNIRAETKL